MQIWGITEDEAREVLDSCNFWYGGNLTFNREPEAFGKRVTGVYCTLRVKDSSGAGARMSRSGRRLVACTYDVHYMFMEFIFMKNMEARIKTAMEDYRGIGEFYAKAGRVANVNVGSEARPARYGDL